MQQEGEPTMTKRQRCEHKLTSYEQPYGLGTKRYRRERRCIAAGTTVWTMADWHPLKHRAPDMTTLRCAEHPAPEPSWVVRT